MIQAQLYHERMRRLRLAEAEYRAIVLHGGFVDPGRAAEAMAALRESLRLAGEAHLAYWRWRREAMLLQAAGSAFFLRQFGRVCGVAGEAAPEFFDGPGREPLEEPRHAVPVAAPWSEFVSD